MMTEFKTNLKSARAYKQGTGWKVDVVFNDDTVGTIEAVFQALEHVVIELASSNLDDFQIEIPKP
jgi:hypothetical protein